LQMNTEADVEMYSLSTRHTLIMAELLQVRVCFSATT
jgi:hypothetical protein